MTVITVPGANNTIVANTFTGVANTALAQSIATTLNALFSAGFLTTQSVAGGGGAPGPTGVVNSLEIVSGGVVNVPAGYADVVDGTTNANLTVKGGNNFFGGDGNINYTNSGSTAALISAGNGNDVFNLSGIYTVAAGSGSDRFNLSGTGTVSLGGGGNSVNISGGADTIFAGTTGSTGVQGGAGSVFFHAGNAATTVADYIVGDTGGDTILGGANNIIIYNSPANGATAPGALLVGGAGNEVLYDVSSSNDALFAGNAGGNQILVAGSGNDSLVAGSGHDSLFGGGGTDSFFITNSQIVSAIIKTAVMPGVDFIYNTRAGETVNLTGFDTLYGGVAGSGAAAKAVQTAVSGSNTVTLNDGTQVTFNNGAVGLKFFSS